MGGGGSSVNIIVAIYTSILFDIDTMSIHIYQVYINTVGDTTGLTLTCVVVARSTLTL